jgi:hypothetical protein
MLNVMLKTLVSIGVAGWMCFFVIQKGGIDLHQTNWLLLLGVMLLFFGAGLAVYTLLDRFGRWIDRDYIE